MKSYGVITRSYGVITKSYKREREVIREGDGVGTNGVGTNGVGTNGAGTNGAGTRSYRREVIYNEK